MRVFQLAAVMIALAMPVSAQLVTEEARAPKPKPDCLDGAKYDDGKFESAYRPGSYLFRGNFVMLFEAPQYPAKLEKVCIAWMKDLFDSQIWFDIKIWAPDGPNGGPGTLLAEIPTLFAGNVPRKAKFYTYDVKGMNVVVEGPVYISPSWYMGNTGYIYLATDFGPKIPRRRGFSGLEDNREDEPPSRELGIGINAIPAYKAFGIRAKFGPP